MTSPHVSIVIPCHNGAEYVGEAIESALRQTYPRTEVIVIDDGSTDGSLEVMRSFGDTIRWETGPNRGACAARNRGVELARGELIQFLDADDLLDATKVERCVERLGSHENRLVYTLHRVTSLDGKESAVEWNRRRGYESPVRFMLQGDLPTPAPLHRKRVIERVGGFREGQPCAQDREFHLRMALAGVEFDLVPEELFTIRRRAGSVGTSDPARLEGQRAVLARETYERLEREGRLTEELAAECAAMMTRAARGVAVSAPEVSRMLFKEAKLLHRSGGYHLAYSRKLRAMVGVLGPVLAERVAARWRRVRV